MITSIEIDGFKSFLDFKLDVPPFLAIVGPNASGKSNLFDALEFEQAAYPNSPVDPLLAASRGRPQELFHAVRRGDPIRRFTIAVDRELLGGGETRTTCGAHYEDGRPVLDRVRFDEGLARRRVGMPPVQADRWYEPEPKVMRHFAPDADRGPLRRDGGNLAAVLGRMRDSVAFSMLLADFVSLVPGVADVVPLLDEHRLEWSFDVVIGEHAFPSTLVSDGTLRILGLLAAFYDPDHPGTLLIEEIENGLHPNRLANLLDRLRTATAQVTGPRDSIRQVIMTSHSPVVVAELAHSAPDSLIFMEPVTRVSPRNGGRLSSVSVALPVREDGEKGTYVSPWDIERYLSAVRQDAW